MINRLEDLWSGAADDGASTPCGPITLPTGVEFEHLMDAWFLERRNSIEFEMLLGQSREIIARLLAEGVASAEGRSRARRLIREIDRTLSSAQADGS